MKEIRRAVERRGLRAFALSFQEGLDTTPDDPVIVGREANDFSKTLDVVRRLIELDARYGFKAIVPVGEFGLLPCAVAASKLSLPAQPLVAVTGTRDKLRMRRAVDRAGLPQPRWAGCETEGEAATFLSSEDGPIIVKPAWGSGSDAVSLVSEPTQLEEAFERIRGCRSLGPVLCEQFIRGPEVSLEACTVDGVFVPVALTDKLTVQDFVEIGHQQPSGHPREVQQAVFSLAEKILAALKLDQTVSHTEFRLSAEGPMLVETHTRIGGGGLHVLTQETSGVDLADLTVGLALGERPVVEPRSTGRGCAVRFLIDGPGYIESIALPPNAEPEVLTTDLRVGVGSTVSECRSSFERLGSAVAIGVTADAAAQTAARHLERIEIGWREKSYERRASQRRTG